MTSMRNPYYHVKLSEDLTSIEQVEQDGDHPCTIPIVQSDNSSYLYIQNHHIYPTTAAFAENVASMATVRDFGEVVRGMNKVFFPNFPQSD